MVYNIFLGLSAILALFSSASAYFLSWGSTEQTSPAPIQYYYHKRLLQGPSPAYTENGQPQQVNPGAGPIPSVPIQTPLRAQLSPLSSVHQVQLVPCMCPVSQDYPFDNYHPQQQENLYVPVQHFQQQPIQHLQIQQPQIQQAQIQPPQQNSQQQQSPK